MGNTRDHLRHGTRAIHTRLHHHTSFKALMDQTITQSGYLALLTRLFGYHRGLERALQEAVIPEREQAPPVDERSLRLLQDLRFFAPDTLDPGPVIQPMPVPEIESFGAYLGVLYVREGSMMGGRALAAKLDHLCGSHMSGRQFFQGGSGDGAAWLRLCHALERMSDRTSQDQALDAAQGAFRLFETWMDPWEPINLIRV